MKSHFGFYSNIGDMYIFPELEALQSLNHSPVSVLCIDLTECEATKIVKNQLRITYHLISKMVTIQLHDIKLLFPAIFSIVTLNGYFLSNFSFKNIELRLGQPLYMYLSHISILLVTLEKKIWPKLSLMISERKVFIKISILTKLSKLQHILSHVLEITKYYKQIM